MLQIQNIIRGCTLKLDALDGSHSVVIIIIAIGIFVTRADTIRGRLRGFRYTLFSTFEDYYCEEGVHRIERTRK